MNVSIPWPILKVELGLIALTLGSLVLDLFLPKEKRGVILANVAMVGVTFLFCIENFEWGNFGYGFQMSYVQNGVSACFKALLLLSAFFALFMAREYQGRLKRGQGEFVLLILIALTGSIFLASANDFLLLFVALETLSISLYIMTAYLRDSAESIEAGVKYLILGALSTSVFLFGLSYVYGATGSTNYFVIGQKTAGISSLSPAFTFGMILILSSLGFKIASVPFQLWIPDIYQGAPTPVTAFLATASKTAGFAALARLLMTVFAPAYQDLSLLFAVLAALTIIYGNLGAIPQTNLKRLLGYSSIGHAGYLMIGLACFNTSGKEALLFYLLSYIFSTAGAFLVLVAVSSVAEVENIKDLAGLSKRSPMLAAAMLISLMSLAGVPPMAGFFAKFYLLWSCVKTGYLWLAIIGVLNVITSLYYYLRVVKVIYVDEPADPSPLRVSFDHRVIQVFVMAGIVVIGVFQGPFVRVAHNAFELFIR
jgi:NADH-quinone oxidoreductase subunit N